jgi:hypothetical protein
MTASPSGSREPAELVSDLVISTLAETIGIEERDLDPQLYRVVHPEALDELVRTSELSAYDPDLRLEFTYCGYRVIIEGGDVRLRKAPGSTDGSSNRPQTTPDAE